MIMMITLYLASLNGTIKNALKAATSFKARALFTLISVALGIASITLIVAAVEGAYKKAHDIVIFFGPDSALIIAGSRTQRAFRQQRNTMTLADAKYLEQSLATASLVVPMTFIRDLPVSYQNNRHKTQVVGAMDGYTESWRWPVARGRDIREQDINNHRNVCLVGRYVAELFFPRQEGLSQYILVNRIPCRVIGILSERGASPSGRNLDDRIIMPLTTVMKKIQHETKYITSIRILFRGEEFLGRGVEKTREILRQRHGLKEGEEDDFTMITPDEIIKFLFKLSGTLIIFLGVTGIVTLLVAGFVLANLFLLSVSERKQEIGIRRAIGAKKQDIFYQFLIEASIITLAGGVLGFVIGVSGSFLLMKIAEFPLHFSWKAFAVGLILSLLVGIGFGIQPAKKAAKLNPIEAIR